MVQALSEQTQSKNKLSSLAGSKQIHPSTKKSSPFFSFDEGAESLLKTKFENIMKNFKLGIKQIGGGIVELRQDMCGVRSFPIQNLKFSGAFKTISRFPDGVVCKNAGGFNVEEKIFPISCFVCSKIENLKCSKSILNLLAGKFEGFAT